MLRARSECLWQAADCAIVKNLPIVKDWESRLQRKLAAFIAEQHHAIASLLKQEITNGGSFRDDAVPEEFIGSAIIGSLLISAKSQKSGPTILPIPYSVLVRGHRQFLEEY